MIGAALARQQHEDENVFNMFVLASFALGFLFIMAYLVGKLWAYVKMGRMQQQEVACKVAEQTQLQTADSNNKPPALEPVLRMSSSRLGRAVSTYLSQPEQETQSSKPQQNECA